MSGSSIQPGASANALWSLLFPQPPSTSINDLSDDLLARVFSLLDTTALRLATGTCRRWAALLRSRLELWRSVQLALPPKRSRGRDRRQSYTTPCALNLERLAAWLLARRSALASLEVELQYPDALALLPQLLSPLTNLRELVLRGDCSDWPYLWVDWRWLGGMAQVERLQLADALPGMAELCLPPSLTELRVDRVGEGDPDTEGWDELPRCFAKLTGLQRLTLGTAATYLLQGDEESAYAPLNACRGLQELALPFGALSAVPDVVASLTGLTLLSFRGSDRLEAFGSLCGHKSDPFAPLAALLRLQSLDFSRCALEELPPWLGGLPQLRTLLLAFNQLTALPPPADPAAAAAAMAAAARVAAGGEAAAAARPVALPPGLVHLDVRGNPFQQLPQALFSPALASQLTHLDLSRCWKLNLAAADWRRLLAALPRLRLLRHSCSLLAAEVRGHGGAARLAAALGGCPELAVEQHPPPERRAPDPAVMRLCEQVLQAADPVRFAEWKQRTGGYFGLAAAAAEEQSNGDAGPWGSLAAAGSSSGADGHGQSADARRVRSCGSLEALEAEAAAALLSGGGGSSGQPGDASD